MRALRIVLCDDHVVFTDAMAILLRVSGHEVVGRAPDLHAASELLRGNKVDVCMLDLSFHGRVDLPAIRETIAVAPMTTFVALTACTDKAVLEQALSAGVLGAARKTDDLAAVLDTMVRAVAGHLTWPGGHGTQALSGSARAMLARDQREPHPLARFLTPREREVLVRMVRGESTARFADSMGIQVSTARTYVDAVLTKLGTHSRAEAVACAVRDGLVSLEGSDLPLRAAGA